MSAIRQDRIKLVRSPQDDPQKDPIAVDQTATATSRDLDWTILMARAQDGDAEAYFRLLEEITPYLRFLASRRHRDPRDIEDSVQDILLTVHTIRQTYDPARPFGPWLVAIANRRIFDRLRSKIRESYRETPLEPEEYASKNSHGEVDLDRMSDSRQLEAAIADLTPTQQQAIRLLKLQELSLQEASTASGISIASLKVSTHRALKRLRTILGEGRNS